MHEMVNFIIGFDCFPLVVIRVLDECHQRRCDVVEIADDDRRFPASDSVHKATSGRCCNEWIRTFVFCQLGDISLLPICKPGDHGELLLPFGRTQQSVLFRENFNPNAVGLIPVITAPFSNPIVQHPVGAFRV